MFVALIAGIVLTVAAFWMTTPTGVTIMLAKVTSKNNLIRKIYPGSRREKLYISKKSTVDDIFTIDPKTKRIDVLDGAMKSEFGSTMVDKIRVHTVMAGDMAPMGSEGAAAITAMIMKARDHVKYPLLSQIRESHKISDLVACDMESLPRKAKKYVVIESLNKKKEDIEKDKADSVPKLCDEVINLRGEMSSQSQIVDYITAINAVLNPVIKGTVEQIDIYIQKRLEDLEKKKKQMMEYGIVFCMIIGVTVFGIIAVTKFV